MPFNFLLWNCLLPGRTSVDENAITAVLRPRNDECVLAFGVGNDRFRQYFDLTDEKACDALFFHKSDGADPTLFFVELKASPNLKRDIEQLGNVIQAVASKVGRETPYAAKAVIVKRGSVPRDLDRVRRSFKNTHQVQLCVVSNRADLWELL